MTVRKNVKNEKTLEQKKPATSCRTAFDMVQKSLHYLRVLELPTNDLQVKKIRICLTKSALISPVRRCSQHLRCQPKRFHNCEECHGCVP